MIEFDFISWIVYFILEEEIIVFGEFIYVDDFVILCECVGNCVVIVLVLSSEVLFKWVILLFWVGCKVFFVLLFMLEDELVIDISE